MSVSLSDLSPQGKTLARLTFLIIFFAVVYALLHPSDIVLNFLKIKPKVDQKEQYINSLDFKYKVVEVIDGDTLVLKTLDGEKINNTSNRINLRLFGIVAPNLVDKALPVECYSVDSKEFLRKISDGKIAAVDFDPAVPKFDSNGDMVGYLFVKDSGLTPHNVRFVNDEMIKNGYVYQDTHLSDYKYKVPFNILETNANNNNIGLWSNLTCKGLRSPVAPPPSN